MKSIVITAITAFAALAAAQSLGDFPSCSQNCVGNSLGSTGCSAIDIHCICASQGWIAGLSCCVAQNCSPADQGTTEKFAGQLCKGVGVTLPSQASCSGSSGASSTDSSGAPATAASSTAPTASSTSETASQTGSAGASSTTSPETSSTSGGSTTTESSSGTNSVTGSSSAAPASTSSGTGVGLLVQQGMGAAGAAVAALVLL
ncbi:hypothetical protein MMC09_004308 [Bachmanniomyces sp. S44760]|nr:hypothetical protein [Bachmanniomyces sp. S44760]